MITNSRRKIAGWSMRPAEPVAAVGDLAVHRAGFSRIGPTLVFDESGKSW